MSSEIPLATIHTVVSQYARGKRGSTIADLTALPVATVTRIGQQYGAPDLGKLARAAEQLREQLDQGEKSPSPGAAVRGSLGVLRIDAERIGDKKLIARVTDLSARVDQLRTDLAAAVAAWDAGEAERAERKVKQDRLAELGAEAAILRAELRPQPKTTRKPSHKPGTVRAAAEQRRAVRQWAHEQGLECAANGIIPAAVVTAYEAAHEVAAS